MNDAMKAVVVSGSVWRKYMLPLALLLLKLLLLNSFMFNLTQHSIYEMF